MDWFKVGYLLVFQLGLGCLVRHISLFCCFWGGLYGLVSCVLARAHRQPLCRSISVVNFHWVSPGCVFVTRFLYLIVYLGGFQEFNYSGDICLRADDIF